VARNPDPKHGRWILPLIIVAMVVLTITFVNSLEPAQTEAGTTTTLPPITTTSSTTLPPDIAAFMSTLDLYETQVNNFLDSVDTTNANWEAGTIVFNDARAQFQEVQAAAAAWESTVAADAANVPAALAAGHVDLLQSVDELAPKIDDIITGLEAPDDGTLRRQAVVAFEDQVDTILAAIADLRTQAQQVGGGAEESTTTTTPANPGEEPTTSIETTTTTTAGTNA
jgi:hypothetical protein